MSSLSAFWKSSSALLLVKIIDGSALICGPAGEALRPLEALAIVESRPSEYALPCLQMYDAMIDDVLCTTVCLSMTVCSGEVAETFSRRTISKPPAMPAASSCACTTLICDADSKARHMQQKHVVVCAVPALALHTRQHQSLNRNTACNPGCAPECTSILRTVLVQGSNQAAPSLLPCRTTAMVTEPAGRSASSPSSSTCCLDDDDGLSMFVYDQLTFRRPGGVTCASVR